MEFIRSYDSIRFGLPRNRGGSAPALVFSRPAQRSLTLRPARSPSRLATLCTRGFSSFVASTTALIATGRSEPVPGRVYLPLWTTTFHGARGIANLPGLSCLTRNNSALRAYRRIAGVYDPQGGTISRKEFHEQKTWFCVCCIDGSSRCSARAGETTGVLRFTGAVHSAREPRYLERKRFFTRL